MLSRVVSWRETFAELEATSYVCWVRRRGGVFLVLCFLLLEERNCEQHVYQSAAAGSAIIDLER
jgi:hypothetical protein